MLGASLHPDLACAVVSFSHSAYMCILIRKFCGHLFTFSLIAGTVAIFPVILEVHDSLFEVAIDESRITQTESLDIALACFMGCYWIFDIQYPKCLIRLMSIQVLILLGESAKFPVKLHWLSNQTPKIL